MLFHIQGESRHVDGIIEQYPFGQKPVLKELYIEAMFEKVDLI